MSEKNQKAEEKYITLEVSNGTFKVSKQTLEISPYFSALLSGNWRDSKDNIFLDEDVVIFGYVLNVMRYGHSYMKLIPQDTLNIVKVRLDYYGIENPKEKSSIKKNIYVKEEFSFEEKYSIENFVIFYIRDGYFDIDIYKGEEWVFKLSSDMFFKSEKQPVMFLMKSYLKILNFEKGVKYSIIGEPKKYQIILRK